MTDTTSYVHFMCNPDNICNCECCPERCTNVSDRFGILPCGQFHCWVELTCADSTDDYEEDDDYED